MSAVLVTVNVLRPEAVATAGRAIDWLAAAGHAVRLPAEEAEALDRSDLVGDEHQLAEGASLAVSLGGDGTMLRTVALTATAEVPILGVNHGALGYLTEVEPTDLDAALERFFAGGHHIERRMLLEVRVERSGEPPVRHLALNEAVLEKTFSGHTVRLDVAIDGTPFTPYETDGLIVATPTGSTAYAFSARGPIVSPTHRLVLLTPVSPHMLFDRTLVLEPDGAVRLAVAGHRSAALAVDGRPLGHLGPGDAIVCGAAAEQVHLVVFERRDFPGLLKAKFKLSDR